MTENYDYYSFFTKYSLMENYGFLAGFFGRIFRKIIPKIPKSNTFEFYLKTMLKTNDVASISKNIKENLTNDVVKNTILNDLDAAITTLSLKITSFGLDHKFQTDFNELHINSDGYKDLLYQASLLSKEKKIDFKAYHTTLDEVYNTLKTFRKNKNIIGTSLHLTIVISNKLSYLRRIRLLLNLKSDLNSVEKWNHIINDYVIYTTSKNSLRTFFTSHTNLLAYEVVNHTAKKGEKYVANTKKEYYTFFRKGLLGGFIIALFALFKIIIDSHISDAIPLAFLYSINYALCFVIVFYIGGTIATKQPGMTASTIAKHIGKNADLQLNNLKDIVLLLRKVSRSQFISLIGNFVMALSVSCLISLVLSNFDINPIKTSKSVKLIDQVFPFAGGALYFATIAGVFLSLSGFISGYFDNKVKAINLGYRIQHHKIITKLVSKNRLKKTSLSIENNLGTYAGNISLGFLLGTAFLISYILPFPVDIRHVAFSSANVGYAITTYTFSINTIFFALLSVLLIGAINFIISFSLTFILVLKSRAIKFKSLGQLFKLSVKDFIKNPLDYFIFRNTKVKSDDN